MAQSDDSSVINSDYRISQLLNTYEWPTQSQNSMSLSESQVVTDSSSTESGNFNWETLLADLSLNRTTDSEPAESFISEHLGNTILVLAYSLIVLVSCIGNVFVFRVITSMSPSARTTTTNMLILNLATSDLLLTTFNISVNIVRFVMRDWPFGEVICSLTPFIQSLSAHCSSITMMVIAFERYQRYKFSFQITNNNLNNEKTILNH